MLIHNKNRTKPVDFRSIERGDGGGSDSIEPIISHPIKRVASFSCEVAIPLIGIIKNKFTKSIVLFASDTSSFQIAP
jgi:hypothetical protein